MVMKLCRSAYEKLIREDIEWLERQPYTLEAGHIKAILLESVDHHYGESVFDEEPHR